MKFKILFVAVAACAAPVWAQPDPIIEPINGLPFSLISPAQIEKLTLTQPIKLKLENVTVAWALENLQAQSGVELDLENIQYSRNTLAKKVSVDIETPSFNRAFDEIMDKAGLKATLRRDDFNRPFRVNFSGRGNYDENAGAVESKQGLFGLRLSRLNSTLSKTVDLKIFKSPLRTQRDTLNVSVAFLFDPRLPLIGNSRVRLTRADDDQGRSLLLPAEEKRRAGERLNAYSFYARNNPQSNLALSPPEPDAKAISHLEGVVVHSIVTKTEVWEVPDLMGAPEWKRQFQSDGETYDVTIKPEIAKGSPENRVTLKVEVVASQGFKANEIPMPMMAATPLMMAMKIRDAKGLELRNNGSSSSMGQDGKLTFSVTYAPQSNYYDESSKTLAMPLQLTFEAPLEVAQTEAPFAFTDVILP